MYNMPTALIDKDEDEQVDMNSFLERMKHRRNMVTVAPMSGHGSRWDGYAR